MSAWIILLYSVFCVLRNAHTLEKCNDYDVVYGKHFTGTALRQLDDVLSPEECCAICNDETYCVAFQFNRYHRVCILQSKLAMANANTPTVMEHELKPCPRYCVSGKKTADIDYGSGTNTMSKDSWYKPPNKYGSGSNPMTGSFIGSGSMTTQNKHQPEANAVHTSTKKLEDSYLIASAPLPIPSPIAATVPRGRYGDYENCNCNATCAAYGKKSFHGVCSANSFQQGYRSGVNVADSCLVVYGDSTRMENDCKCLCTEPTLIWVHDPTRSPQQFFSQCPDVCDQYANLFGVFSGKNVLKEEPNKISVCRVNDIFGNYAIGMHDAGDWGEGNECWSVHNGEPVKGVGKEKDCLCSGVKNFEELWYNSV